MKTNFIENSTLGKNKWWQYVLSVLTTIVVIAIVNIIIRQVLPNSKKLFPDNDFGKGIFTFCLILVIFGLALIVFLFLASKLHQRPKMSFISNKGTFSCRQYFIGFLAWGSLLFIGSTIFDYQKLEDFIVNFNLYQFIVLLLFGFLAIGVQSFFEELVIRGYFLQGLHLHLKNIKILILVNGVIFGVLHFGYGVESFLSSWVFGIAFAIIVHLQNSIEFVSGAHNANNLLLSLVFLDLSEATNQAFSWEIDWGYFSIHIISILILVGLVYKYFRKK